MEIKDCCEWIRTKALFLDPSEDKSFPLIKLEGYNNVIHCAPKLLNRRQHSSERPHHH